MLSTMLFVLFVGVGLWTSVNTECGVLSKKDWGGLEPMYVRYLARPVNLVIIQHSITPKCTTDAACGKSARYIQRQDIDQRDHKDIGASFLVGGNAKIYEGAGWLHQGAHTNRYSNRSIGISFIGNYNNDEATTEMLEAASSLLKCGVESGHLTSDYYVIGYNQLFATASPGRNLYSKIRQWPEWLEDVSKIKNQV